MIAVSSPGFSMTPFPEMLEAIAPHFKAWEIIAEGVHAMPDIRDGIGEAKDSYDMEFAVHAPFSDLNIASLNAKARENALAQVTEAIKISAALEIAVVTLHPGHKSPLGAYFPDKAREVHMNSLRKLDSAGREHGITLALENMPRMWISLCASAEEVSAAIHGTDMKVCFDIGHANISGDVEGFFGLSGKIANLHLHDNFGKVDRHLVLGKGGIDIPGILKRLAGYRGLFVIECMDLKEGIESKTILEKMLRNL